MMSFFSIKKSSGIIKLVNASGIFLFSLMLFAPTALRMPKIILMVLFLIFFIARFFLEEGIFLSKTVLYGLGFTLLIGLFGFLRGIYFNTPGAFKSQTVFLLWPILYCLFISQIRTSGHIKYLFKVIIMVTVFIVFYTIFFLMQSFGFIPEILPIRDLSAATGGGYGYIKYNLVSISTLVYTFPFLIIFYFSKTGENLPTRGKLCFLLLILVTFLCALSTGRRALLLGIPLTCIYLFFIQGMYLRSIKIVSLLIILLKYSIYLFLALFILELSMKVSLHGIYHYGMSSFDFNADASNYIRKEQFFRLMSDWRSYPFLGAGSGASNVDVTVRDFGQSWGYELSYVALLFQYGVIGFMAYLSLIVGVFFYSLKIIKEAKDQLFKDITIAALGALILFLFANSTNPYMGKFDSMWTIFFQVAIINVWLLNKCDL